MAASRIGVEREHLVSVGAAGIMERATPRNALALRLGFPAVGRKELKNPNRHSPGRGLFINRVAKPVGQVGIIWCSFGAIGMERMDFVLLMDKFWFTP